MSKNKYPWPHPKPNTDAGESLRTCLVTDPRDWGLNSRDAWIYGIVEGWDDTSLDQLQKVHGWNDKTRARLIDLHRQFEERFPQWWEHESFDEHEWIAKVLRDLLRRQAKQCQARKRSGL